jgi:hypothetical protein
MCGDMEKMENEGIFCPLKDIPAFPWNDWQKLRHGKAR